MSAKFTVMKSVIICDMEGLIKNINAGAVKMFGYSEKEVVDIKRVSLFSPGEIVLQNVLSWLKKANKKGEYTTETNFIRKDGSTFNAKITITPNFANGKQNPQTGYCGITEEIDKDVKVPIYFYTKIIKFLAITRVGFASVSIFPIFVTAAYLSNYANFSFNPFSLFLTVLTVVMVHIFTNLYNDYFDVNYGTDDNNTGYFNAGLNSTMLQGAQLSGGSRAVELGLTTIEKTKKSANKYGFAFVLLAVVVSGISFYNTQSITNAISGLAIAGIGAFLGYFYTAKPIKLSYRYGLGELSCFLCAGPLLTLASGYAISNQTILLFSPIFYDLVILGMPLGLLTAGILFINQFPDYEGDKKSGKKNLVVVMGKSISRFVFPLFFVGSFLFLMEILNLSSINNLVLEFSNNLIFAGFSSFLVIYALYIIIQTFINYKSRKLIKANLATIYYNSLFALILIVLINIIL